MSKLELLSGTASNIAFFNEVVSMKADNNKDPSQTQTGLGQSGMFAGKSPAETAKPTSAEDLHTLVAALATIKQAVHDHNTNSDTTTSVQASDVMAISMMMTQADALVKRAEAAQEATLSSAPGLGGGSSPSAGAGQEK